MTKDQLQAELKEKVKEGVKPSDIKRLKRSKSADDIPQAPILPNIKELQEQVRFHAETAQNYLKSLQVSQAKVSELEEKLKTSTPPSSELDNSLFARHQNLKDWFTQYKKNKSLEQELEENIDVASSELITQDEVISQLRSENRKLKQDYVSAKQTNSSLQKDLDLAHRAVAWRQNPLSPLPSNYPWLPYALSFLLIGVTLYLTTNVR